MDGKNTSKKANEICDVTLQLQRKIGDEQSVTYLDGASALDWRRSQTLRRVLRSTSRNGTIPVFVEHTDKQ